MTDASLSQPPEPKPGMCQECGCTTGGGTFCYEHKPFTVRPLKDGSFYVDRYGRQRVTLDYLEAARLALAALHEAAGEHDAITALLSDRAEPGLYAKVEALLTALAAQAQQIAKLEAELTFARTFAPMDRASE